MRKGGIGPKFLGVLLIAAGLCALTAAMWWPVAQALLGIEASAPGGSSAGGADVVYLRDGSVRQGQVLYINGTELSIRAGGRETAGGEGPFETLNIADIAEVDLGGRYIASMPRVPRIYFQEGSVLVGSIEGPAAGEGDSVRVLLTGPVFGEGLDVFPKRSDIVGMSFSEWCNPFSDSAGDMVRLRDGAEITGKIDAADRTGLHITRSGGGAPEHIDFAKVSTVTFAERPAPGEMPASDCVVCVADGSRLKGTFVSLDDAKLELVSPVVGKVTIERGAVTRIAFTRWAVEDEFPVVLEDDEQTAIAAVSYDGIRRVIRPRDISLGKRLWVSHTPCGTIFVGDEDGNTVYEIDESGRVLWRFQGAEKPTDAFRLADGNTLICDYGNDRLIEASPDGRTVWQAKASGAMGCARLRNGRNLVVESYSGSVVELDQAGNAGWEAGKLSGVLDALRLDDGNTLVLCSAEGAEDLCLRKIDAGGNVLWTVGGFSSPARIVAGAEDRILVCESGAGKLTILDNHGRRKRVVAIRPPQL